MEPGGFMEEESRHFPLEPDAEHAMRNMLYGLASVWKKGQPNEADWKVIHDQEKRNERQ